MNLVNSRTSAKSNDVTLLNETTSPIPSVPACCSITASSVNCASDPVNRLKQVLDTPITNTGLPSSVNLRNTDRASFEEMAMFLSMALSYAAQLDCKVSDSLQNRQL